MGKNRVEDDPNATWQTIILLLVILAFIPTCVWSTREHAKTKIEFPAPQAAILPPVVIDPDAKPHIIKHDLRGFPAPLAYTANTSVILHFIDPDQAPFYCNDQRAIACQTSDKLGRPEIVMPNPCEYRDDPYAITLCHELAHVNGWVHGDQGEKTYTCVRDRSGELSCERD